MGIVDIRGLTEGMTHQDGNVAAVADLLGKRVSGASCRLDVHLVVVGRV